MEHEILLLQVGPTETFVEEFRSAVAGFSHDPRKDSSRQTGGSVDQINYPRDTVLDDPRTLLTGQRCNFGSLIATFSTRVKKG